MSARLCLFVLALFVLATGSGTPAAGGDMVSNPYPHNALGQFTSGPGYAGVSGRAQNTGTLGNVPPVTTSKPTDAWGIQGDKGAVGTHEVMTQIVCAARKFTINVPQGHEDLAIKTAQDYTSMPKALTNANVNIWFSSFQSPEDAGLSAKYGRAFRTAATHLFRRDDKYGDIMTEIYVWGNGLPKHLSKGDLVHELAHGIDRGQILSSNQEYKDAVLADLNMNANSLIHEYVSDYAAESAKAYDKETYKLAEDFAESVRLYVTNKENFAWKYPNRTTYLDKILGPKE
jgi:hypothetical protein